MSQRCHSLYQLLSLFIYPNIYPHPHINLYILIHVHTYIQTLADTHPPYLKISTLFLFSFSLSRASGRLFKKMKHLLLVWWPCNLLDDLSEWQSRGMDAIEGRWLEHATSADHRELSQLPGKNKEFSILFKFPDYPFELIALKSLAIIRFWSDSQQVFHNVSSDHQNQ